MKPIGYKNPNLDNLFFALADPTRRAILARLTEGAATVTELAEPFSISQPAVSKHLKILEKSGLIERGIDRQARPAQLKAETMKEAADWLTQFRRFWSDSFDQLDELLETMEGPKDG